MDEKTFLELMKFSVTDIHITNTATKVTPMGKTLVYLATGYLELLKNIRIVFTVCRNVETKERMLLWPTFKQTNSAYRTKLVFMPNKEFELKLDQFVLASYRAYMESKGVI